MEEVEAMRLICELNGIDPLVERSRSGRGTHVWIFFDKAVSASTARKFGNALLERGAETVNLKSFQYYDRMLPAQYSLPGGGLGNLIALPLQGSGLQPVFFMLKAAGRMQKHGKNHGKIEQGF